MSQYYLSTVHCPNAYQNNNNNNEINMKLNKKESFINLLRMRTLLRMNEVDLDDDWDYNFERFFGVLKLLTRYARHGRYVWRYVTLLHFTEVLFLYTYCPSLSFISLLSLNYLLLLPLSLPHIFISVIFNIKLQLFENISIRLWPILTWSWQEQLVLGSFTTFRKMIPLNHWPYQW